MKSLFLAIALSCLGNLNAQCVKLYVKEHLSGSPICQLIKGDYIEICEDMNKVNGCPRDFYIYDKGFSSGSLTYELSLDRGWSVHYMTMMVNPSTHRFLFILQGQTALYSYYTESEMAAVRASQNELRAKEAAEAEKRKQKLLKEDQQQYRNIQTLLTNGKIEAAKSAVIKLNFPDEFPFLNELHKKEDALLETQIRNLLSEKKLDEAIKKYDALNLEETKNALFSKMQLALSDYYKTFEQQFKVGQLPKIINENKVAFAKLAPGSYKISSDSEGNLSVDGRALGINSTPLTKTLGSNDQFTVNTSASGTLKIEQTTSNNGAEQILVSTTKPIFETRKGKLYKYVILGGPGYLNIGNHVQVKNITVQEDIPPNKYRKVQPLLIRTTANSIEIDSKQENKLLSEEKFKNRTLAVFSRSVALGAGIGVLAFYIYLGSL